MAAALLVDMSVPTADQTIVSNLTERDEIDGFDEDGNQWKQAPLFGRDEESRQCREAFDRITASEKSQSEVLLLPGNSGCGKSVLAETLRGPTIDRGGYYTGGKFDQFSGSNLPYSAITNALSDLIDLVQINKTGDELEQIREAVKNAVDGEDKIGASLLVLIPNLGKLVGIPNSSCHVETSRLGPNGVGEQTLDRLKATVRNLLKAIASRESPIVMFLDDLQWIDLGSLELLQSLIMDLDSKHILIVLAYRDDEIDFRMRLQLKSPTLPLTYIQLSDLSLDQANDMIASLLEVEDDQTTTALTEILHSKTNGNPFFLAQTLYALQVQGSIVRSNDEPNQWSWDCARVNAETLISDNVLEVIAQRLDALNSEVRFILEHAACLGFRFQVRVLETIVDGIKNAHGEGMEQSTKKTNRMFDATSKVFGVPQEEMTTSQFVSACLLHAANEGLAERSGAGWFRFTHDRFQQYFYECLGDEKSEKNLMIGRLLQLDGECDAEKNPSLFLLAIDQLNAGYKFIASDAEILSLMRLNVKAANLARTKSAYWTARTYVLQVLEMKDSDFLWGNDYDLALECYTVAAEVNYICSYLAMSDENIEKVLLNARTFRDKLPVTVVTIVSLSNRGHTAETTRVILETLDDLKRCFPDNPSKLSVVRELFRVTKAVSKLSDEQLLNLPDMTDEVSLVEVQLIRMLSVNAFAASNDNMAGLCGLRMMLRTCQHGFSEVSPFAFAFFGLVQSSMGRVAESERFGDLSMKLLRRNQDKHFSHRTINIACSFCLHYSQKLDYILDETLRAFQTGLDVGFTYEVATTGSVVCSGKLHRGRERLDDVLVYISAMLDQMAEHEFGGMHIDCTRLVGQVVANLAAEDVESPWILNGHLMREADLLQSQKKAGLPLMRGIVQNLKLEVAVVFEKWTVALQESNRLGDNEKSMRAHYSHMFHLLYTGLTYTVAYNRSRSWLHKRRMNRKFDKLRKFADSGVVMCRPLVAILVAERSAIGGDKEFMVEKYQEAIRLSAEDGFINYEALAAIQLVRNLEEYFQDKQLALSYIPDAISAYERWGAMGKARLLRNEFGQLNGSIAS